MRPGRPPKADEERRQLSTTVRFTRAQKAILRTKAAERGITVSKLVGCAALELPLPSPTSLTDLEMVRQMAYLGSNLNQAIHHANSLRAEGIRPNADEIIKAVREVRDHLAQIAEAFAAAAGPEPRRRRRRRAAAS